MKVFGLDFTSAPDSTGSRAKKKKRLMLAVCSLHNERLKLENFRVLNRAKSGDFGEFEEWLSENDEVSIAGIDFPFGQPAELVQALQWPTSWAEYVTHVERLGKEGFEQKLISYKESKPAGQKHLLRAIDRLTKSQSPMTLSYTPVGKMFFQGAYRLCNAEVSVVPVRLIANAQKTVVEAYPALVARRWIGPKQGYKNDDPKKADRFMTDARCEIVSAIRGKNKNSCRGSFKEAYGFTVDMTDETANQCVEDFTGDLLDSVLCAVQAAWAYGMRHRNYGVPHHAHPLEGWICDPSTIDIADAEDRTP